MPITVLDNARGFEEGLQYANNVYNRIQDYAKHQNSLALQAKQIQLADNTAQLHAQAPLFLQGLFSGDEQSKLEWANKLRAMQTEHDTVSATLQDPNYVNYKYNTSTPGMDFPVERTKEEVKW